MEIDIALLFEKRAAADFVEVTAQELKAHLVQELKTHSPPDHGRIDTRSIWCTTALNAYLDLPHAGQVFLIERESLGARVESTLENKTGVLSREIALGIASRSPQEASSERVLAVNRGHWGIESVHLAQDLNAHYIIDWNFDEDRSQIRTGFGPENITRLRRFAVGILKSFQKPAQSIAEMMRKLSFRTRLFFDYLRLTQNSTRAVAR